VNTNKKYGDDHAMDERGRTVKSGGTKQGGKKAGWKIVGRNRTVGASAKEKKRRSATATQRKGRGGCNTRDIGR